MPLPKPRDGESKDDFISRCMADNEIRKDFEDNSQRAAVCNSLWEQKDKKAMSDLHNPECFADHMGPWMIQPTVLSNALNLIKAGKMPIKTHNMEGIIAQTRDHVDEDKIFTLTHNGIAIIPIVGTIAKSFGKFNDASSVFIRMQLRAALKDDDVKGIMLEVTSPGGTVAGTDELANDVALAANQKPLRAHIQDLGASAAIWIVSQATIITANKMARIGSIGTMMVLEDTSGAAELAGIKVHAITTGIHKAAGVEGVPITEEQIGSIQDMVNEIQGHFVEAVATGRGMEISEVEALADGDVMMANKALEVGLIDGITTFEAALHDLGEVLASKHAKEKTQRSKNILDLNS